MTFWKTSMHFSLYRSTCLCGSWADRYAHWQECVIGVFLHMAEILHSMSQKMISDAFSWLVSGETVTVLNVIAIASLVSEIWLAMERQIDRQTNTRMHARTNTHTVSVSSIKITKVAFDFAKKRRKRERCVWLWTCTIIYVNFFLFTHTHY